MCDWVYKVMGAPEIAKRTAWYSLPVRLYSLVKTLRFPGFALFFLDFFVCLFLFYFFFVFCSIFASYSKKINYNGSS